MAPNSSSVFNEAPTETKPTPTDASLTKDTTSECSKQPAPKMEATVDDDQSVETETTSCGPDESICFARVAPVVLEDAKKTLVFRKSCLKRSSSFFTPATSLGPSQDEEKTINEPTEPVQKNKRRCWECKAKIGLTAVTCRCDYTFCNKHRYAEEHNCRFNFKSAAKRKLENENPRVVPAKVARIN